MPPFLPRQGEVAAKLTEGEVNDSRRARGDAPSTIRCANGPPPPPKRGRIHHTRGRASWPVTVQAHRRPRHPGLEPGSRFFVAPKAGPRITSGVTMVARPNPDPTTDQRVATCPHSSPARGRWQRS